MLYKYDVLCVLYTVSGGSSSWNLSLSNVTTRRTGNKCWEGTNKYIKLWAPPSGTDLEDVNRDEWHWRRRLTFLICTGQKLIEDLRGPATRSTVAYFKTKQNNKPFSLPIYLNHSSETQDWFQTNVEHTFKNSQKILGNLRNKTRLENLRLISKCGEPS